MTALTLLIAALTAAGLVLLWGGARRVRRRRRVSGAGEAAAGAGLLAVGVLLAGIAANLYTYQRLTQERPAAELTFRAVAPQRFQVYMAPAQGSARSFEVRGDEWQLDARILKWRGYALVLGLDTVYRLERLSGRYRDVEQARRARHTVHALARDPGPDLWRLAERHPRWVPWVDAHYGNAAYMPMADGARFAVAVSASGLVARPLNAPAREALAGWSR